jgi:anti-sigma regulatory factor (Ser/Thr protein kinase)
MPTETVRLRIANLGKAVLVSGQAYQEPKDALNEFVSNAADEYAETGRRGARITLHLRRRGRRPLVAVSDEGRGLSPGRLRQVARNLFESTKAGDDRTLGEKAIGILAFQQLGARCDVVSRAEESAETWCLRLRRGEPTASLGVERRRARPLPGTTVYLADLDPEVLRVLTARKVVDYLRVRRGPALAAGDYEIEVIEGGTSELVIPDRPDGMRLPIAPRSTLWGRIDCSLWVAPPDGRRRRVTVVGRAGTTILDDLAAIEEFDGPPWTSDQVAGQIAFPALQQTAGRRAVLRDREAFPLFFDMVRSIEPAVAAAVERVARDVDAQTSERLADTVRRIFRDVLRELEDVDNPMRTPLGSEPGDGAVLDQPPPGGEPPSPTETGDDDLPVLELTEPAPTPSPRELADTPEEARPSGRSTRLPSLLPDPDPGPARSRFDADAGVVLYNETHADYLLVKDDEAALLEYLTHLVVKEYVVYNQPRAQAEQVAEEMIRMLVRVRRHVPRLAARRRRPA